mmetsp:Transcript_5058/g.7312  ORF Transcript_5058/g.7312 Transcript_5058/m.7312 type:complete len:524 (+) Transcript_5058:106-1677(+)
MTTEKDLNSATHSHVASTSSKSSSLKNNHNSEHDSNMIRYNHYQLCDPKNSKKALLSVPICDFPSLTKNNNNNNDNTSATENERNTNDLILCELPSTLSIKDIMKNSKFIIKDDNDDDDDYDDDDDGKKNSRSIECRLIVEDKATSHDLVRAETSNTYILAPPNATQIQMSTNDDKRLSFDTNVSSISLDTQNMRTNQQLNSAYHDKESPSTKKRKTSLSSSLTFEEDTSVHVPSRLLRETNTFILECSPPLSQKEIQSEIMRILSNHSNSHARKSLPSFGWTLNGLATKIMCSTREIQMALEGMDHVFSYNTVGHQTLYYALLKEELGNHARMHIVHTLTEWDGAKNYGERSKGIDFEDMIREVLNTAYGDDIPCMEGQQPWAYRDIIRHCLNEWKLKEKDEDQNKISHSEMTKSKTALDVDKIALFLGCCIFNSQPEPWEQSSFISEWHALIPGIGKTYQPDINLLLHHKIATLIPFQQMDPIDANASLSVAHKKGYPVHSNSSGDENYSFLKYCYNMRLQ